MKRVLVIGSPGTGKTTFAKKLADKTGLPLIYLDRHYHDKTKAYFNELDQPAWFAKVDDLIGKDKWIIDGNYNSTLDKRVKRADTIIFLDLPRRKAFEGIFKRRVELRKKVRPDMPDDWSEHLEMGFLKYVWNYNKHKRPKILDTISEHDKKTVIIFKNHRQTNNYLERLALTK